MMTGMIFDAIPFRQNLSLSDKKNRPLVAFTDYLEKKLGAKIVQEVRDFPFSRPDLKKPLEMAALLKKHNIIKEMGMMRYYPDDPRLKGWYALCNTDDSHQAGGATWQSDEGGLYAALCEALERYIWMTQTDYFKKPIRTTTASIAKHGRYIAPETFVGFSDEQRALAPTRVLRPDSEYLWIQGVSLVDNSRVYLPAQIVMGVRRQNLPGGAQEPFIRQQITNGLATWPTREGALVAGALEIIEREAYMMMWLNQLTLPRIAIQSLTARSSSLAYAIAQCKRYRFKVHVISLPTDAPTHAVAVVLEDLSGNAPKYTVGLKTHWSMPYAVEKAITEALRSHRGYRHWAYTGNVWDNNTPVKDIGHRERLYYWGVPENAKHLEFMIAGKETVFTPQEWDSDTPEQHLKRIIAWCKEKNFDCVSVPLTHSAKNPTPFHIEMVVIPQLQPTYLEEWMQQFGGTRWKDVPKALGYNTLEKPFADRPHPFS